MARLLSTALRPPLFSRAHPHVFRTLGPRRALCAGVKTELVPTMGDSITEGSIVEWVKGVGDYVAVDDVVVVVETDKVTIDIRAEQSGTLRAVHAAEDDVVEVGAALYDMEVGAGEPPAEAAAEPAAAEPAAAAQESLGGVPASDPAAESRAAPGPAAGEKVHSFEGRQRFFQSRPHRRPLIAFTHGVRSDASAPAAGVEAVGPAGFVYTGEMAERPAQYGRPPLSEFELELILGGGCDVVEEHRSIY
jgi:pyruvate/2-oxoglutarate dehydrogenase complex dihydrolipoamide acyltransferase (E2) component